MMSESKYANDMDAASAEPPATEYAEAAAAAAVPAPECVGCNRSEWCTDPERDNGRKIKDFIENPFSAGLLRINDPLLRPMARKGISANMLTFASLITGLLAVYFVWDRRPLWGGLFYIISYFFDCADGCMARFTHTESEFGDRFDHYKDIFVFTLLIVVTQIRYPPSAPWWALFLSLFALSLVHFGSVERFNELNCGQNKPRNVLGICKRFSRLVVKTDDCGQLVKSMRSTRWFGDGSLVFAIGLYLITRNPQRNGESEVDATANDTGGV